MSISSAIIDMAIWSLILEVDMFQKHPLLPRIPLMKGVLTYFMGDLLAAYDIPQCCALGDLKPTTGRGVWVTCPHRGPKEFQGRGVWGNEVSPLHKI